MTPERLAVLEGQLNSGDRWNGAVIAELCAAVRALQATQDAFIAAIDKMSFTMPDGSQEDADAWEDLWAVRIALKP